MQDYSNDEIKKNFSLKELKNMYISIYNRKPTSSYIKEKILSVLRNRMHGMKRAESFQLLAIKDKKRIKKFYNFQSFI